MKVLITGITGQDGIFLVKKLLNLHESINIYGVSRNLKTQDFLKVLNIKEYGLKKNQNIRLLNIDLNNSVQVENFLNDIFPHIVFNLSGPSSVYESIRNPNYENEIKNIFTNLINALINTNNFCRFFQASTSEMYGLNNRQIIYDETSLFKPNSPYAKGKLHNHLMVSNLNKKYNWDIYSGIMFNHESEYRKENYLFMKLIKNAYLISQKKINKFTIGSLEFSRDWSYAGDISEGIYEITQKGKSFDYVLGSGIETKVKSIVEIIFDQFNLNYEKYINLDPNILRKNDPVRMVSNPKKINEEIGWKTKMNTEKIIEIMIKSLIK